jgi:hypothetical protein
MPHPAPLERGYLLLADLSGYTAYLAASEPEHAPIIAGDFIETVVGRLRGTFRLEKLEGDAAFLWAPAARVEGSLLLDAIEAAYVTFQRRLQSVSQATTCDCETCRRMPQLDLKFVIHVGDVLRQRIAGREEVAGRDVIVAHRLLKGTATERAGARSYLLMTDAVVVALGLDPAALGLTALTETYDELGPIHCQLLDLAARFEARAREAAPSRPAGKLLARMERLLPASPEVAWELLTAPRGRTHWEGIVSVDEDVAGRRGIGTLASCVVGRLKTVEEILDWRPFDGFARRMQDPRLGRVTSVYRLAPLANGTHLEVSWFAPARRGSDPEQAPAQERFAAEQSEALDRLVAAAERQSEATASPIPATWSTAAAAPQHGAL